MGWAERERGERERVGPVDLGRARGAERGHGQRATRSRGVRRGEDGADAWVHRVSWRAEGVVGAARERLAGPGARLR